MLGKSYRLFQHYQQFGLVSTIHRFFDQLVRISWWAKYRWDPRQLVIPLERIDIRQPVFFLGTQGAGLTLLTRMVRRHPDVVMAASNSSFWAGPDEIDKFYKDMPDALALRSPGYRNMWGNETNHPIFGLERSWVYATNDLLDYYRKTKQDWNKKLDAQFKEKIKVSIRTYAHNPAQARFIDKSQTYTLKIPFLRECFSDARFILVLRNPYAMCWREATTPGKYRLWNIQPTIQQGVEFAAEHWTNTYSIALSDYEEKADSYVIKFEDFLKGLEIQLKSLLEFIDIDFDPDMLPSPLHKIPLGSQDTKKWYPIKTNINEKYLAEITPQACDIVEAHVDEIASKFGYERPK